MSSSWRAVLLAAEGMAAGRRTLTRGETPSIDAGLLDRLNDHARRRTDPVERLRIRAVTGMLPREIEPCQT